MTMFDTDTIAARFEEAAEIADRLPSAQVHGFFNVWPTIMREQWATYSADDKHHRYPPRPDAVARMSEVMQWVQWLSVEQRHLVWMRARNEAWRDICQRFGCDRSTAWRRWQKALQEIEMRLKRVA